MSTAERPAPKGLLINSGFSQIVAAAGKRTARTTGPVSIDEHGGPVGGGDQGKADQRIDNVWLRLERSNP